MGQAIESRTEGGLGSAPAETGSGGGHWPENGYSVAEQLLLYLARTKLSTETADRLSAVCCKAKPEDWADFTQLVTSHGVVPLVYRNLASQNLETVPEVILAQLRVGYERDTRWTLRLLGELFKVCRLLKSHGIQTVPLKGPVLGVFAYGDVSLRRFDDLDLLIREQDAPRVRDLLMSAGYRPAYDWSETEVAKYLHWWNQIPALLSPDGQVNVELHVRLAPRWFPLQIDHFWNTVKPLSLLGRDILCFPKEELLIYLSIHGAKHDWERLQWLCDIDALVQSDPAVDWPRTLDTARRLHSEREVLVALHLAHKLLGTPLPPGRLASRRQERLVQLLVEGLPHRILRSGDLQARDQIVQKRSFHLMVQKRLRDRLLYARFWILRHLSLPRTQGTPSYVPSDVSCLRRVPRLIQLTHRYGFRLLKNFWRHLLRSLPGNAHGVRSWGSRGSLPPVE